RQAKLCMDSDRAAACPLVLGPRPSNLPDRAGLAHARYQVDRLRSAEAIPSCRFDLEPPGAEWGRCLRRRGAQRHGPDAALDPENLERALRCVRARARMLPVVAHPSGALQLGGGLAAAALRVFL